MPEPMYIPNQLGMLDDQLDNRLREVPAWLDATSRTASTIPITIAEPPQDEYIPSGREFSKATLRQGMLQDLGMYGAPLPQTGGDPVLYPEDRSLLRINTEQGKVYPDAGRRMYDDLQNQYNTGGIADEEALRNFYRNPDYKGMITPQLEKMDAEGNQYLRRVVFGGEKGSLTAPIGVGPRTTEIGAQKMYEAGATQPEIFKDTGWYMAPDGRWKWVLSDEKAELNNDTWKTLYHGEIKPGNEEVSLQGKGPWKLPDILKHPDLYATYPSLRDVNVDRFPQEESVRTGVKGDYNPQTNTLRISSFNSPQDTLSYLIHEVQHSIQSIEDFATGGSADEFVKHYLKTQPDSPELRERAWRNYLKIAGETEARQAQEQLKLRDWSQMPTRMPGFPAAEDQLVRRPWQTEFSFGNSYKSQVYPDEGENIIPNHLRNLPGAVQDSILHRPSFGEGEIIPSSKDKPFDNYPDTKLDKYERERALADELSFLRQVWQYPLRENQRLRPLENPYGRPQGYPFALY